MSQCQKRSIYIGRGEGSSGGVHHSLNKYSRSLTTVSKRKRL